MASVFHQLLHWVLRRRRYTMSRRCLTALLAIWMFGQFAVLAAYLDDPALHEAPLTSGGDKDKSLRQIVYDYNVKKLAALGSSFNQTMVLEAVFVVLGFLALFGNSKTFELPVLKLQLPLRWVMYVVPTTLLFLWLQFGFLLDELINARSDAFRLLLLEGLPARNTAAGLALAMLNDSGFIDAWFMLFRDGQHVLDQDFETGTAFFFGTCFGLLLGLTHAMIAGMFLIANARYRKELDELPATIRIFIQFLPYGALLFLLASNFQFFAGGGNPNWFQSVIAGFAALGTVAIDLVDRWRISEQERIM